MEPTRATFPLAFPWPRTRPTIPWAGLGWAALIVSLAVTPPVFLPFLNGVNLVSEWPALALVLASVLVVAALVGSRLPPAGVLIGWMLARHLMNLLQSRSGEVLWYVVAGALLWFIASTWSLRVERWVTWGILVAVGINAVVGVVNVAGGVYPVTSGWGSPDWRHWQTLPVPITAAISAHVQGLPSGLQPHPNTWGLLLAFGMPLLAWRLRRITWETAFAWLGVFTLLIATSRSRLAVGLAVIVLVVTVIERASGRARVGALAVLGLLAAVGVWFQAVAGPWAAGGGARLVTWQRGLPEAWNWKWIGHGLGMWGPWATAPTTPIGKEFGGWYWTAFSEPLELVFDLGLIGVALVALGALWLGRMAWRVWRETPAASLPHAWVLTLGLAAVAVWVSSPLHTPILAGIAMISLGRIGFWDTGRYTILPGGE